MQAKEGAKEENSAHDCGRSYFLLETKALHAMHSSMLKATLTALIMMC